MQANIIKLLRKFKRKLFKPKGLLWKGYKLVNDYYIHHSAVLIPYSTIKIGKNTEIKISVVIQSFGHIEIGENCQINPFTVLYGGYIYIGNNVIIAPHCTIASGNHDHVQLLVPMRYSGILTSGPIIIEDDVWIGANATILDGVKIGKGAVVAASSCVTKDVESYGIYAGVPAKKIGSRLKN